MRNPLDPPHLLGRKPMLHIVRLDALAENTQPDEQSENYNQRNRP